MQIVIEMPEHYYENNIKNDLPIYLAEENVVAILPKGHGRLIDADELELDADWDDYYDGYTAYSESMIKYAPTIIEADTESEDQEW